MLVSAAESRVMDILWGGPPLSNEEIVLEAVRRHGWGPATVKTLIGRLLKKKAIRSERAGGRVVYHALISRDEYLSFQSQTLLDRLFGGQVAPLVAHYARHRGLTPDERTRLKSLIEELGDDD